MFIIIKQDLSAIIMHTRQHEVGQEMQLSLVFNAIERYEKRYGFVHMLSINRHHYGCIKLTMSIDASGTIRNCEVVYSIGEKLINHMSTVRRQ